MENLLNTPAVFYKNQKLPCVVSTERRGTITEIGGQVFEVSLTVIIRKDVIPDAIVDGDAEVGLDWSGNTDVVGSIFKEAVRLVATTDIDLSLFMLGDTIDGEETEEGDRILLTAQIAAEDNGIYVVSGDELIRALDCDSSSDFVKWFRVNVTDGTHADEQWMCSNIPPVDLGTDNISFTKLAVRDVLPETPTTPYSGRQIGRKTKLYRIINVREDPAGSHFSLDLSDLNR